MSVLRVLASLHLRFHRIERGSNEYRMRSEANVCEGRGRTDFAYFDSILTIIEMFLKGELLFRLLILPEK